MNTEEREQIEHALHSVSMSLGAFHALNDEDISARVERIRALAEVIREMLDKEES